MATLYVLSAISIILYGIYYLSKRKFNYWKLQNVPHLEPTPIFGNYKDYILMKKFFGEASKQICEKFPTEPYIGTFYGTEPALLIQSPDIIKLVTTKDFYYFSSREVSKYIDKEVFSRNMFFAYGDRWRILRQNSTALFSSTKIKNMYHLIEERNHQFENLLKQEAKLSSVEIRSLTGRLTMDVIGSCFFGINPHVMEQVEGNMFKKLGDKIFELSYIRGFLLLFRSIWPAILYGLRIKILSNEYDIYFGNLLKNVFKSRNYEPSNRNDFVDLIMSMKKNDYVTGDSIRSLKTGQTEKVSMKADDDFLVTLCFTFFGAGFETSSTTMSYTLYELAKNEEAQKKAMEEVDAYLLRQKNKLKYEGLSELPYLEACVDETLRLYPVLAVVTREVVEDYTLPSGVLLKKGLRVHIPVYHLHRKAEYFPQPDEFRPERFYGEEKRNIKPYTFMPFGEGPRICIGMRFARMSVLTALITILKGYRVELAEGTPRTLQFDPRSIVTVPVNGKIHLRLIPRPGSEERMYAS